MHHSAETARQHALSRYALSDAAGRQALERITLLTTQALGVPGAQLNLISAHAQHTWAHTNWPGEDLPRELGFCFHTLRLPTHQEVLEVPDTWLDPRFEHHPFVTASRSLRYYAGAQLRTPDGHAIGSLCLLDTHAHGPLTFTQRQLLTGFAQMIVTELERQRAVRELHQVFEERHTQEARLRALMDHTSDLIIIKNQAGRFVEINRTAEAVLGPRHELLGHGNHTLFDDEQDAAICATDDLITPSHDQPRSESRLVVGGRERVFEAANIPLILPTGEVDGVIVVARDLTERRDLEQALREANTDLERRVKERTLALEHLAYHDSLTRLSNRQAFDLTFDTRLASATGLQQLLHVLIFDLDELKDINEQFGYARGDEFLTTFASALEEVFYDAEVFRIGGDEFAVLIQGQLRAPLATLAEQAVQRTRDTGFLRANASVGTATYPTDAQATSDLMRLADQRMLRDKTARRSARHFGASPASLTLPAENPGAAVQAVRSTLKFLTQEGSLDSAAWKGLLEAAVVSVPGAEAGSLTLRQGDVFTYTAQVGYSDALLQIQQTAVQAQAWHGGPEWAQGRARILSGQNAVLEHTRRVVPHQESRATYEQYGALSDLRANLSVPVELGGEVVAEINLDNLHQDNAFDHHSVVLAEEFASLAAALISDSRRRAREQARQRELEVMVRLSRNLRETHTLEDVETGLCLEAAQLLGNDQVVYLRYEPEEDALRLTAHGWPDEPTLHTTLRGDGELWVALLERRPVQLEGDLDHAGLFHLEHATLLVTPLHAGERPVGVIVAARPTGATFSAPEIQLVGAVASSGVTALQRIWAEQANADRVAELHLLADLSRFKSLLDTPEMVAQRCLSACQAFLGAEYAGYLHLDRQVVVDDGVPSAALRAAVHALTKHASSVDDLLDPDAPLLLSATYASHPKALPALIKAGVQGAVFVPVLERGRRVGLVSFVWFQPRRSLPAATEALAMRVAELIGRVLERQAYIEELKHTHEGALLALGLSLELRDFETHGHTERVVRLAVEFGHRLGLKDEEMEGLRQGAYLHDIGKLAIPDSVLLKPGKLDADEWTLMQAHSAIGAELISRIPTIPTGAKNVIRHHHERWDGTGYPDGLSGEAIPLVARLFSLVDVYDALVSMRPYKRAWTHQEAYVEIRRQAGTQFDPALVDVFLALFLAAAHSSAVE
ncbi:diguanylate cyclase [Deinococcus sp. Arct2-2]|uniref:sensor domain-containing diguanylate cyclase/phosphohydrolase n=1 Tax=Deinococcus sp. Arct2-2 TaxID=2568653 RepID=UPI0010A40C4A|nr:HD domain-containing phosphohydrolase [Deinococcus sp. Arct2-2]THF70340.1 diguanylate cyclase [Deinococcus sp. Arct2-2]